jgi:putative transposase
MEKLRYIHRNPVRRGLIAKPEDWPWSSFFPYGSGWQSGDRAQWTARRWEQQRTPAEVL